MNWIFHNLKKASKKSIQCFASVKSLWNMHLIFHELGQGPKIWILFFANWKSSKHLQKHEFCFCKLKKAKNHEFNCWNLKKTQERWIQLFANSTILQKYEFDFLKAVYKISKYIEFNFAELKILKKLKKHQFIFPSSKNHEIIFWNLKKLKKDELDFLQK